MTSVSGLAHYRPQVVDWRITSACDLDCPFCYAPKRIRTTSLSDAMQIAKNLIDNDIRTVCLTGGEPTLYVHLQEIVQFLYENQVRTFLSTDGNFFEKHRSWIEKYVVKISLPLDGPTPVTHATGGRTEENFHNVVSILESYRTRKPLFIKIGTVVSKKNISGNNLHELKKLLTNYNIDRWKLYEFLPEVDFGQKNRASLLLHQRAFDDVVNNLLVDGPVPFKIIGLSRQQRTRSHFLIQPNGDVIIPVDRGEIIEEKILGNILSDPFTHLTKKWSQEINISNYVDYPRFMMEKAQPQGTIL